MNDPYITKCGHTFEGGNLFNWYSQAIMRLGWKGRTRVQCAKLR